MRAGVKLRCPAGKLMSAGRELRRAAHGLTHARGKLVCAARKLSRAALGASRAGVDEVKRIRKLMSTRGQLVYAVRELGGGVRELGDVGVAYVDVHRERHGAYLPAGVGEVRCLARDVPVAVGAGEQQVGDECVVAHHGNGAVIGVIQVEVVVGEGALRLQHEALGKVRGCGVVVHARHLELYVQLAALARELIWRDELAVKAVGHLNVPGQLRRGVKVALVVDGLVGRGGERHRAVGVGELLGGREVLDLGIGARVGHGLGG